MCAYNMFLLTFWIFLPFVVGNRIAFVITLEDIYTLQLHNGNVSKLYSFMNDTKPSSIFYTGNTQNVSMFGIVNKSIIKKNSNNNHFIIDFGNPSLIFVDEMYQNLYFVDNTLKILAVTPCQAEQVENTRKFKVLTSFLGTIQDLAFDPLTGSLFWIERQNHPFIMRYDTIEIQQKIVIYNGIFDPKFIEINPNESRLFWYDAAKQTVESADYNGMDRKIIYQSHVFLKGFRHLSGSRFLIYDATHIALLENLTTTYIEVNFVSEIDEIFLEKMSTSDLCLRKGCGHFCFPGINTVLCECFEGYSLSLNGRDCLRTQKDTSTDLVLIRDGTICMSELDIVLGKGKPIVCHMGILNVFEAVVASDSNKIIFIEYNNQSSWRIIETVIGKWMESVLLESSSKMTGLHMGPNGTSFFFAEKNFIKESNFDITFKRVEDTLTISSLSVDIHNRILAWTTSENYYIQISTLDGRNVRQIMQSLDINYLFADPLSQRIFWGTRRGIMSVNNYGNNVKVIRRLNYTMHSLNVLQGLVIWTENQSMNSTRICSADYGSIEKTSSCVTFSGNLSNIFIQDEFLRSSKDICALGNGGCDQLCISSSAKKCFCYEGFARQNESKECRRGNETVHLFAIDNVTNTVYGVESTYQSLTNFSKEKQEIIDVDIDVLTGDLYILHYNSIKHLQFGTEGDVSSHIYFLDGQSKLLCYDWILNAEMVIKKSINYYSLYKLHLRNGSITELLGGILDPLDLICVPSKSYIVIANDQRTPVLLLHNLKDNTTISTPAFFKSGNIRLAMCKADEELYSLEMGSSKIYRISFDWKTITILYEDSNTIYRDIDVDENYIYAVGMYNRMIHVIRKSTGKLQSQKPLSPYLGTVSFILKVPVVQRGYQNTTTLNDPFTERDNLAIILISCFAVLTILVVFVVTAYTFSRRRGKFLCVRRNFWENSLSKSNIKSIYSISQESSIRHPPPLPKRP